MRFTKVSQIKRKLWLSPTFGLPLAKPFASLGGKDPVQPSVSSIINTKDSGMRFSSTLIQLSPWDVYVCFPNMRNP